MNNLKATTKQVDFFSKKLHAKIKGDVCIRHFAFYCLDDKPKQCEIFFDEFHSGKPERRKYTINFTS